MRIDHPLDDVLADRTHVRVLRALVALPEGYAASGREVARRSGVSHPAANRALRELNENGLLHLDRRAGSNLYALDPSHVAYPVLEGIFRWEGGLRAGLVAMIREALDPLRPQISRAVLFGSAVWGDMETDSDIDLAIVRSEGARDRVEDALAQLAPMIHRRFGNRLAPLTSSRPVERGAWKRALAEGLDIFPGGQS